MNLYIKIKRGKKMSKVLGIIAEYNPFHNGHLYHLNESKKITNSNFTIVVISGNFTQRGEPAIIDKWSRAKSALLCGADLVIELPVLYAISSAENFADGAIKILNSLNIVNYLSIGTETKDLSVLNNIATVLNNEPQIFKNELTKQLNNGLSYPKARENALMMYFDYDKKYENIITTPNNILGIEYLKSLQKHKSNIVPYNIKRIEVQHNSTSFSNNIASGSAIRNILMNNKVENLSKFLPPESYSILNQNIECGHIVKSLQSYEKQIIYALRKMDITEIANLPDVSEGLENAIKKATNSCNNLTDLINSILSKRYTATRIQRILLYALLNIKKSNMKMSKEILPYIRVLGFNEKGKILISDISHHHPKLEIITSVKKFEDKTNNNNLKTMLNIDKMATDIYTLGYQYDSYSNLDYTNKIISI